MRNPFRFKRICVCGIITVFTGLTMLLPAQGLPPPELEIPIYTGVAPGSEEWDWTENSAVTRSGIPMVQNVTQPFSITLQIPPGPWARP